MAGIWRAWLMIWCAGVALFGMVIAGAASGATEAPIRWLLQTLQGEGGEIVLDPALRFSLALMGCVSLGWAATMLSLMRVAFSFEGQSVMLWRGLSLSICFWYVIDSALSAATGFAMNILPNTLLLVGYLIPVLASGALKSRSRDG